MRKEQRLRRARDFAAAYRRGATFSNRMLVVRVRHNGADRGVTRFGFVAGKAVGGAVARNRVKRRLREAARTLATKPGLDVVVGARKPASHADYGKLRQALTSLMARSGALETDAAPGPACRPGVGQLGSSAEDPA